MDRGEAREEPTVVTQAGFLGRTAVQLQVVVGVGEMGQSVSIYLTQR